MQATDDIGRPRLDWPEPLVLEIIGAAYGASADADGAGDAVRLHARFLRALMDEGETGRSSRLRIELIARCAACRISSQTIAAADLAVLSELTAIVDFRFRNSPCLRRFFGERLDAAVGRLAMRPEPRADAERPRRLRFASASHQPQGALAFAG